MKEKFNLFVLLFLILQISFWGCKKEFIGENAEISTSIVQKITDTTAECTFRIVSTGGTPVIESGLCWSTFNNPTTGDNRIYTSDSTVDNLTIKITGLAPSTTYFVRAYAINTAGTSYSNEISFTTLEKGTIADADGNIYHTLKIGNQIWLIENLKTTKYNDGTNISYIPNATLWQNTTTGAYCYHNNTLNFLMEYGAIYNFYALNTGKLAPEGWRIATLEDWNQLESYLTDNGYGYDGSGDDIARTIASNYGWEVSTIPGTVGYSQISNNSTGFNALSTGYKFNQIYSFEGIFAVWWTNAKFDSNNAYYKYITNTSSYVLDGISMFNSCFYVRCIKN